MSTVIRVVQARRGAACLIASALYFRRVAPPRGEFRAFGSEGPSPRVDMYLVLVVHPRPSGDSITPKNSERAPRGRPSGPCRQTVAGAPSRQLRLVGTPAAERV